MRGFHYLFIYSYLFILPLRSLVYSFFVIICSMRSIVSEISDNHIYKYSTGLSGYISLAYELKVFEHLKDSNHIPKIIKSKDANKKVSIYMEKIKGTSLKELLGMQTEYDTKPLAWGEAKKWLTRYIDAEMDLLNRGVIYRDMNLDHIIFSDSKAYLIDLESTIIKNDQDKWHLNDMRGTWETMAPEEFRGYGELSTRTATYRSAVIAHLILTGKLPFESSPHSRSTSHHRRLKHPAKIDPSLSAKTRRVFMSALARKPTHRYKDPARFLENLVSSY